MEWIKQARLSNTRLRVAIKGDENTKGMRTIRFTNVQDIVQMAPLLKEYIQEAVEKEKAGLKVEPKATTPKELTVPEELHKKLVENSDFKTAFEALSPGKQRAYIVHFSEPKQAKTRETRVEKCIQQILEGKELNYQYMK